MLPPPMPLNVVEVDTLPVSVPAILDDCFNFILAHGLIKGIFRVSGLVRRMKAVSSDYSNYRPWLEAKPQAHDVCGIIKKYLSDYLATMNGLFSQQLLALLRRRFISHRRSGSDCSIDSYKSANTSFGSLSLSSVPESESCSFSNVRDADVLLDAVAHLLVTKNISSKNNFFIYLLYKLKQLSQHEDTTSMSVENTSIIFQPYIFSTQNVADLRILQDLLSFLVLHFDLLLLKYQCYVSILGGLEDLELDSVSISSSEGNAVSPATVYSESSYTPRHNSNASDNPISNPKRKSSISRKFNGLLESYHLPANRSKRFSFNFSSRHQSTEKVTSSENLRPSTNHVASLYSDVEPSDTDKTVKGTHGDILTPPADETLTFNTRVTLPGAQPASKRPSLPHKKSNNSKRRSLIYLFKSSSSVNDVKSKEDLSVPSPAPSPTTPTDNDFPILKTKHAVSVDNLVSKTAVTPSQELNLLGRNLSLRVRGRK